MSVYQSLSLMLLFAMFVLALLTYINIHKQKITVHTLAE